MICNCCRFPQAKKYILYDTYYEQWHISVSTFLNEWSIDYLMNIQENHFNCKQKVMLNIMKQR